ncbi:uncharacterized protein LOC119254734 [Talpa occidentalis]|uniref:uncharacterized protein LOC119254734 n=1 Tax=Talpa occidentalis TaxID=50954 RepID=UPI001890A68C|nr:uncharacterized protein LOC119254734 [Talpa occidentalis]
MFPCCWPRSPRSGQNRGQRNPGRTLLESMRRLCRRRRSPGSTGPEKVLSVPETEKAQGVQFSNWPPTAQCDSPRSAERSMKRTHNMEIVVALVHRNWQEYMGPMEELPEEPSPRVQRGSSVDLGTGWEPGQDTDWRTDTNRCPEGTGKSPANALVEQQDSPAGLLAQVETAHDDPGGSGVTKSIKPVDNLPEGVQRGSSAAQGTGQEPGKHTDWMPRGQDASEAAQCGQFTPPLPGQPRQEEEPNGLIVLFLIFFFLYFLHYISLVNTVCFPPHRSG